MCSANFIYFQQTSYLTTGNRYTFVFSTGGVISAYIITYNGATCNTVTGLAVTSKMNVAMLCDDMAIQLYGVYGQQALRVNAFQYAPDNVYLSELAIDSYDTLLGVARASSAVVAVPADGSGAKHVWRPDQSSFSEASQMSYDPYSDTLLTWFSATTGQARAVQRVDARTGALVDVLALPDRLTAPVDARNNSNCFVRSAPVGQWSGRLYRLLSCAQPKPHLRLYVTSPAGQLKREVSLMAWTNRFNALMPLVVDEAAGVCVVALYGLTSRNVELYGFSLGNGTQLYHVRLGLTSTLQDMSLAPNHTLLVTFPARIYVVNVIDGTQPGLPILAPPEARFTSAVSDGARWYFAQTESDEGGAQNSTVLVYDSPASTTATQALVVGAGHRATWLQQPGQLFSLQLTRDGRLYALDRYRLAAWWDLNQHSDEERASARPPPLVRTLGGGPLPLMDSQRR